MFNNNFKPNGKFGMVGFTGGPKMKKNSIMQGDWDRDGVKNIKDCSPLNHKKQDACAKCGETFSKYDMVRDKKGRLVCEKCSVDDVMERVSNVRYW